MNYQKLFNDLAGQLESIHLQELRKQSLSELDIDSDSTQDLSRMLSAELLQRLAEHRNQEMLPSTARKIAAAAGRLTMHAAQAKVLNDELRAIEGLEKLYAQGVDDDNAFEFWNGHVVPFIKDLDLAGTKLVVADEQGNSLVLVYAAVCRVLASRADAAVAPIEQSAGEPDYRPADWFRRNTKLPQSRLRQAATKRRKTKRVRTKRFDGTVQYSAMDARKYWPDEMKPTL
jgi:hypothetical protein